MGSAQRDSTGLLTCANAGHEYPFIRTGGAFRLLRDRHDMMVGIMQKARFPEYTLALSPGDAVFVYTNGVPEANNAADEMFGMDRPAALLNRAPGDSPEGILKAVRADVDAFVDGARQFDDLTMLCLIYWGTGNRESHQGRRRGDGLCENSPAE